jgi:hypothetical protein
MSRSHSMTARPDCLTANLVNPERSCQSCQLFSVSGFSVLAWFNLYSQENL